MQVSAMYQMSADHDTILSIVKVLWHYVTAALQIYSSMGVGYYGSIELLDYDTTAP